VYDCTGKRIASRKSCLECAVNKVLLIILVLYAEIIVAAPRQIDEYHWVEVERIVAIGDLHGDFDGYMNTLQAAGLVDQRGRWAAGETHLVQTGDIPDRGPDTYKIIQHMAKLAQQARKRGGQVHNLLGNHEAMNVYGDLRYVTPEEFEAFASGRSKRVRENYFAAVLENMATQDPTKFANLPEDYRERWFDSHPLGWIEHRQAWNPNWADDGELYQWVSAAPVAIQINDTLFVHGGISAYYCRDSLASMTERAQDKLQRSNPNDLSILTDEFGPLWYRGLAGKVPEAPTETVEAILRQHQAARIVVGHTPTGGYIWPRYDGRVIQIDTGIGAAYGGHVAYLEITPAQLFAGYLSGKTALPTAHTGLLDYLKNIIELLPDNNAARNQLLELQAEQQTNSAGSMPPAAESVTDNTPQTDTEAAQAMPICGTRL
jgi:hypothetical protein